jgi:hypothetical protein
MRRTAHPMQGDGAPDRQPKRLAVVGVLLLSALVWPGAASASDVSCETRTIVGWSTSASGERVQVERPLVLCLASEQAADGSAATFLASADLKDVWYRNPELAGSSSFEEWANGVAGCAEQAPGSSTAPGNSSAHATLDSCLASFGVDASRPGVESYLAAVGGRASGGGTVSVSDCPGGGGNPQLADRPDKWTFREWPNLDKAPPDPKNGGWVTDSGYKKLAETADRAWKEYTEALEAEEDADYEYGSDSPEKQAAKKKTDEANKKANDAIDKRDNWKPVVGSPSTTDDEDPCIGVGQMLAECEQNGWSTFDCQVLKSRFEECGDPTITDPASDSELTCGVSIDAEAARQAAEQACWMLIQPGPDGANPCTPLSADGPRNLSRTLVGYAACPSDTTGEPDTASVASRDDTASGGSGEVTASGGSGEVCQTVDVCASPIALTTGEECNLPTITLPTFHKSMAEIVRWGAEKLGGPIVVLPVGGPEPPLPGPTPEAPGPTPESA